MRHSRETTGHPRPGLPSVSAAVLALALLALGCGAGRGFIYTETGGPRYFGSPLEREAIAPCGESAEPCSVRVVSFNIKFAEKLQEAIQVLRKAPLAGADVILLQEMSLAGTEAIACALGMDFVYYPAAIHPSSRRQFGVALLAPWPISDDVKVVLPCLSDKDESLKVSLVATVRVKGIPVRVANVHLQTSLTRSQRNTQLNKILKRVCASPSPVIIAGDFNSDARASIRDTIAQSMGPVNDGPSGRSFTILGIPFFQFDLLFARSLKLLDGGYASSGRASDHRVLWARMAFENCADMKVDCDIEVAEKPYEVVCPTPTSWPGPWEGCPEVGEAEDFCQEGMGDGASAMVR